MRKSQTMMSTTGFNEETVLAALALPLIYMDILLVSKVLICKYCSKIPILLFICMFLIHFLFEKVLYLSFPVFLNTSFFLFSISLCMLLQKYNYQAPFPYEGGKPVWFQRFSCLDYFRIVYLRNPFQSYSTPILTNIVIIT